jgi:hypothetical protein
MSTSTTKIPKLSSASMKNMITKSIPGMSKMDSADNNMVLCWVKKVLVFL